MEHFCSHLKLKGLTLSQAFKFCSQSVLLDQPWTFERSAPGFHKERVHDISIDNEICPRTRWRRYVLRLQFNEQGQKTQKFTSHEQWRQQHPRRLLWQSCRKSNRRFSTAAGAPLTTLKIWHSLRTTADQVTRAPSWCPLCNDLRRSLKALEQIHTIRYISFLVLSFKHTDVVAWNKTVLKVLVNHTIVCEHIQEHSCLFSFLIRYTVLLWKDLFTEYWKTPTMEKITMFNPLRLRTLLALYL